MVPRLCAHIMDRRTATFVFSTNSLRGYTAAAATSLPPTATNHVVNSDQHYNSMDLTITTASRIVES